MRRKYAVFVCKECDIDFIVRDTHKKKTAFCCNCGEKLFVELVRYNWMEKPSNHHRKWTKEEDEIIIEARKRKMYLQNIVVDGRTKSSIERRWRRLKEMGLTH